ncbi:hypothetical protein C1A40_13455 [Tamlana carrageenivorans]|uniref:Uncharacterized protein n=1 Tax=Pseudotamlana carrageenivorans TaxID=2069432 RepID=A0A2I7SKE9_9FLAO|nr:hypothetical protein C1A40_13455 [Tamlana carrageenivorans]
MNYYKLTTLVLLGLFVFSCQNQDDEFSQSSEKFNTDGMLQLGAQLQNPYAVSIMKKAYENLKKNEFRCKVHF